MAPQTMIKLLTRPGIVPVIRLESGDKLPELLEALRRGGIRAAELTMTMPNAPALLRENRADRMRLLSAVDVLVDGPFRSHERSLDLLYRGSKNQRLIDMPATLKSGTIRLYAPPEW